ncbi:MAG: pantoate--beta-alanine ligase [Kiritimatiellia bacterium]
MLTITTPTDLQHWALAQRAAGRRIGCVPTMGCLHEGHLSLVTEAQARTDDVVLTLFVNPTQFGPAEDFSRYPRTVERDLDLCRAAGVAAVFLPQPADMYAPDHSVYVVEEQLGSGLCGAARPGHFRGVCTIVAKLFNLALPHVAVFGQKDYQQAAIIRRMVRDLNFPVEIVVAPILREPDGLAMSSRNRYLSADERVRALGLSRALQQAQAACAAGETHTATLCQRLRDTLAGTYGLRVDYVSAVDGNTLEPASGLRPGVVIALAAFAGNTRLIDNTVLKASTPFDSLASSRIPSASSPE